MNNWDQTNYVADTVAAAQSPGQGLVPFSDHQMSGMFTGLLRCRTFFNDARRLLARNQFNPGSEDHYVLLWDVMCRLCDHYDQWTCDMVLLEVYQALEQNPGMMPPVVQHMLTATDMSGIVFAAFHTPTEHISIPYCRDLLREFLEERTVVAPLRYFMESAGPNLLPENFDNFLDGINEQRSRVRSMQDMPLVESAPDLNQQLTPSAVKHLTGVPFIDGPLGGMREGDTNGIIGVTGAGKSTLGAHMAVDMAKNSWDRASETRKKPGMVVFFTYEEEAKKMYPRIWSAAFKIRRNKLEDMTKPADTLTTRANMEEYERRLSEKEGGGLCEQERWQVGRHWLNQCFKLFDMSGSGEYPNAGAGYIAEMAACLEWLVGQTGNPIRAIVVDYAGLVCKRYMRINNIDDSRLRNFLSSFGDEVRREISERFACTSWILHQIAAQEGTRRPTKLLHHSMASESKAFAENMAVCGCIGTPDQATGVRMLNWSKVRYTQQDQVPPVPIRINDQFAIMEDMSARFEIDPTTQRFIDRNDTTQFQGGSSDNSNGNSVGPRRRPTTEQGPGVPNDDPAHDAPEEAPAPTPQSEDADIRAHLNM